MKPYGHSRKDKLECKYGCCTLKSGLKKKSRSVVDRTNRKTARQDAKKIIVSQSLTLKSDYINY